MSGQVNEAAFNRSQKPVIQGFCGGVECIIQNVVVHFSFLGSVNSGPLFLSIDLILANAPSSLRVLVCNFL